MADEPFVRPLRREKRMVQGSPPEVPTEELLHAGRGVVADVRNVMEGPPDRRVVRVPVTVGLEERYPLMSGALYIMER